MLKWGLRELLREREKGVLRATRSRTPFQVEYPPGFNYAIQSPWFTNDYKFGISVNT